MSQMSSAKDKAIQAIERVAAAGSIEKGAEHLHELWEQVKGDEAEANEAMFHAQLELTKRGFPSEVSEGLRGLKTSEKVKMVTAIESVGPISESSKARLAEALSLSWIYKKPRVIRQQWWDQMKAEDDKPGGPRMG